MPMKYTPQSILSRRRTRTLSVAAWWPLLAVGCGPMPGVTPDAGAADVNVAIDVSSCGDACTSAIDSGLATDTGPVIVTDAAADVSVPSTDAMPIIDATSTDVPGTDVPSADVSSADVPATVNPQVLGVFHLGTDIEFDLVIEADGSFRWRREDCAASSDDCGSWRAEGNDIVLSPGPGRFGFDWMVTAFREPASNVRITPGASADEVIVRGLVGARGARPFEQPFTRGRVCAVCSGGTPSTTPCSTAVSACTH